VRLEYRNGTMLKNMGRNTYVICDCCRSAPLNGVRACRTRFSQSHPQAGSRLRGAPRGTLPSSPRPENYSAHRPVVSPRFDPYRAPSDIYRDIRPSDLPGLLALALAMARVFTPALLDFSSSANAEGQKNCRAARRSSTSRRAPLPAGCQALAGRPGVLHGRQATLKDEHPSPEP